MSLENPTRNTFEQMRSSLDPVKPEQKSRMRIEFADDADMDPDVAVLKCGTWEMVTRLRGIENFRKTAGCDRMGPHDFVVEREVRSDFAGVVGWEQVWKSRCCGVERRWGFSYERLRA